jgi:chromosome segregation ATPase
MHRISARFAAIALVVTATAALAVTLRAQSAPAAQQDILPALLAEVRGLRAAMEQMAAAGPRVQLALGRLQLQEQRINTMLRRLEALRDTRTSVEAAMQQHQSIQKELEAALARGETAGRAEREDAVENIRREMARLAAELQRVTAEESALSADIAGEQGRWNLINQQLEELERTLGRR